MDFATLYCTVLSAASVPDEGVHARLGPRPGRQIKDSTFRAGFKREIGISPRLLGHVSVEYL